MIKELEIGEKLGIVDEEKIDRVKNILEKNNLPTKLPENCNIDKILELVKTDKKGEFVFALDKKNYNVQVSEKLIREVLSQ